MSERTQRPMVHLQLGLHSMVQYCQTHDLKWAFTDCSAGRAYAQCFNRLEDLNRIDWKAVPTTDFRILPVFYGLLEVDVYLYEPLLDREMEFVRVSSGVPDMTAGRAALLTLMGRYLSAFMDVGITLLEIHKLMYFMQEAGEPLRLRFTPAYYGPYAENLRYVLRALEGHYISGYGDEDDPKHMIELHDDAFAQAETFLVDNVETQQRYARVAELIEGFETPFGMELLATVHWVATRRSATTLEEICREVYAWNKRKRMFTADQIAAAHEVLERRGWLRLGIGSQSS